MTATAGELAEELLDLVDAQLAALATGPLPGLQLPGMLLGHEVGADVRADLVFTLGLLHDCGRRTVAGIDVTAALSQLLAGVDGRRTHTFYSYRIAETVARAGKFEHNPLLEDLDERQRAEVALAADSTDWVELLQARVLPRNYAAVLARCELARERLGLPGVDAELLATLLDEAGSLLGGHLDDSNTGTGRYDVYTVDLYLFCEPFAERLGDPWRTGVRAALDLVDVVAASDGTAIPWGRSSGVLAICHTIELAGLVARHDLVTDPSRWYARAEQAAAGLTSWFDRGWVTAHQHRAADPYRGLDRRLQMTLDCLGKLVEAARGLRAAAAAPVGEHDLHPGRDELVRLEQDRHAAAWVHRGHALSFVVPVVGGTTSDYVPAPREPGLFEHPVGSELVSAVPLAWHRGQRYVPAGLPVQLDHRPGELHARYDGWPAAGFLEPGPGGSDGDTSRSAEVLAATREVTWRVRGRTLQVHELLEFDEVPRALSLQVCEAPDRPLLLEVDGDVDHRSTTLVTDGLVEYRSSWGELPRVHQVDLTPSPRVELIWSVTPALRVLSSATDAEYHRRLYEPLGHRVRVVGLEHAVSSDPARFRELLDGVDVFHLHWPEWLLVDLDAQRRLVQELQRAHVPVVWTQHNLLGHDKNPESVAFYELWAGAADVVVHHSEWGRRRCSARYRFAEHARHVVVPHGHWGVPDAATPATRAQVEQELGLRPGVLRLAIVGAPRVEKDVAMAMRAVARCERRDLELLVLSLADEEVPEDPRIVARPYEVVPRHVYDRRLAAVDALVLPFDPDGDMLTTGTVADAVAHGLPVLASSWEYLTEALGAAAITYGRTEADLVRCLEHLTNEDLAAAADAAVALRAPLDWPAVAERLWVELDRVSSTR